MAIVHSVTESDTTAVPACLLPSGGGGLDAKLCPTLVTPWTVACQAPLPMGFSRQECWSGLPFSSPGNQQNMQFFPNLFCSRFFFFFKEVSHCINAPRNKVKQIF